MVIVFLLFLGGQWSPPAPVRGRGSLLGVWHGQVRGAEGGAAPQGRAYAAALWVSPERPAGALNAAAAVEAGAPPSEDPKRRAALVPPLFRSAKWGKVRA